METPSPFYYRSMIDGRSGAITSTGYGQSRRRVWRCRERRMQKGNTFFDRDIKAVVLRDMHAAQGRSVRSKSKFIFHYPRSSK